MNLTCTASAASSQCLSAPRRSTAGVPAVLQQRALSQRLSRRFVAARAEEAESSAAASTSQPAAAADDGLLAAEQLLAKRRKPKKEAGPKVVAPVRDQVYGGAPMTAEQKAENTVVASMASLFFVILAEGIFLAGSGFMPDGFDQFAQDVVYPAFSPTLGLFLAISTAYGLWKTRQAGSN